MGMRQCFESLEGVCDVIPALAVKYFRLSECGVARSISAKQGIELTSKRPSGNDLLPHADEASVLLPP